MGDKKDSSDGFDIKFTALPPNLVVQLWTLALDADTSHVNLAYRPGSLTTGLSYNYGGSLAANFAMRRFSSSLGYNPSNSSLDLGLVYRGFRFNATQGLQQPSTAVSLGYGAPLLPFPAELDSSFRQANAGFLSLAGDAGSLSNPLAFYKLHSNDVTAISNAIKIGQSIHDAGKSQDRFGFNLRLNYNPETSLTIYGAVGVQF
jgi:hypothetical protein